MKPYQIVIILMILSSCSSIGKKTILYGVDSDRTCFQFELRKDKSFEIYRSYGIAEPIIRGEWNYVSGDTIKLNTYEQPKIKKAYFKGKNNLKLGNKIKVQILDYRSPLIGANVWKNDKEEFGTTDLEGIHYFNVKNLNTISIDYLGYEQATIELKDSTINDIQIYLSERTSESGLDYYVDKLVVANNKEIIINPKDSIRRYSLRKSKLKNKCWK